MWFPIFFYCNAPLSHYCIVFSGNAVALNLDCGFWSTINTKKYLRNKTNSPYSGMAEPVASLVGGIVLSVHVLDMPGVAPFFLLLCSDQSAFYLVLSVETQSSVDLQVYWYLSKDWNFADWECIHTCVYTHTHAYIHIHVCLYVNLLLILGLSICVNDL